MLLRVQKDIPTVEELDRNLFFNTCSSDGFMLFCAYKGVKMCRIILHVRLFVFVTISILIV